MIGLDGLDPRRIERLVEQGRMPAVARLIGSGGGLRRVATTRPAQTPVAWSSFATGQNPGGHGIFDFLRRNPSTYLPDLSFYRFEQPSTFLPPRPVNRRGGPTLWECLSRAGRPSTVLRCPCSFPPEKIKNRLLAGMGVPDLRGGLGTPTFYTTDRTIQPGESEVVVHLVPSGSRTWAGQLIGPRNPRDGRDTTIPFRIEVASGGTTATLKLEDNSRTLNLFERCWSDWLPVKFKAGMLNASRGLVRFFVNRLDPEPELYASPINYDPEAPPFPISHPLEFAWDLADAIGPYHTTGMVEDHTGMINGRLDEDAFLAQCDDAWREREAMVDHELSRFEEGFFYVLFDTPDRVQHLFWRHAETDHPAAVAAGIQAGNPYASVIDDQYARADRALAATLDRLDDPETLVIAMSDHGFDTFRRGVEVNRWLMDQGLLALTAEATPGDGSRDLLRDIDWTRTQAYSLGLAGIYINRAGREASGVVTDDQLDDVCGRINHGLTQLLDPTTGSRPIRRVLRREDAYRGPHVEDAPDLLLDFHPGYRIGWEASRGGVAGSVFVDNLRVWSGDHILAPEFVPGFLASSRPIGDGDPTDPIRMIDLAPTILDRLGTKPAPEMEGHALTP